MIFGSVCSGIEAASVAFPEHWEAEFFSEIEKFPSAVLAHHYPDVPNLGDMTKFNEWKLKRAIRLLCGGTPCQSFSIAGLRKGLDDTRGNLMLTFGEMAAKLRPDWLLWENVPGVLSSNQGRDFGSFLGLLSGKRIPVPKNGWGKSGIIPGYGSAYGIAYRVFDAQYFGVAQRRRRVFVVGYLGDWRPAAAVLFERESLSGNPAPRRETGKEVAGSSGTSIETSRWQNDKSGIVKDDISASFQAGSGTDERKVGAIVSTSRMVAFGEYADDGTASAMKARDYKDATDLVSCIQTLPENEIISASGNVAHCLQTTCDDYSRADGFNVIAAIHPHVIGRGPNAGPQGKEYIDDGSAYCMDGTGQAQAVAAFKAGQGSKAGGIGYEVEMSPTLSAADSGSNRTPALMQGSTVRRLTPVECERLQGFPDGYTDIKLKGKPTPDGPRYKALGNSWAVPNVAWIASRIDIVDKILRGN